MPPRSDFAPPCVGSCSTSRPPRVRALRLRAEPGGERRSAWAPPGCELERGRAISVLFAGSCGRSSAAPHHDPGQPIWTRTHVVPLDGGRAGGTDLPFPHTCVRATPCAGRRRARSGELPRAPLVDVRGADRQAGPSSCPATPGSRSKELLAQGRLAARVDVGVRASRDGALSLLAPLLLAALLLRGLVLAGSAHGLGWPTRRDIGRPKHGRRARRPRTSRARPAPPRCLLASTA